MVDLTKDKYRDAQWRIWKAGREGVKALTAKYTTERAKRRIAAQNPFAAASPQGAGKTQRDQIRDRMAAALRQAVDRNEARGNTQGQIVHLAKARLAAFDAASKKEEA